MIRDIRRNGAQPKDTMHKAGVALVTGMGVVIKDATTVELPKAETVANIYVATKERIPTGVNAARMDICRCRWKMAETYNWIFQICI